MKRLVVSLWLMTACWVHGDTLTLRDGTFIRGTLQGFSDRKFKFMTDAGDLRSDYAVEIHVISLDSPVTASVKLIGGNEEEMVFNRLDHNMLKFKKDGQPLTVPAYLLKGMMVLEPVNPAPAKSDPSVDPWTAPPPNARDWKREGKWREIVDDKTPVISHGEVIDIDASLKKGMINVIHFHYPRAVGSVREGNYLQGIMKRYPYRLVVLKVVAQDFRAPICEALNLKTLPQFWFYNRSGRLVKKLTDRFTEADIDQAIKDASR